MINILMYVVNGLFFASFIGYVLLILMNNKTIKNSDGFNITKDILNEYDSINIIENRSYFTIYNIRRKVIKIASKCYYGKRISDVAIPLMEAGISIVDNNKNKFILFMKKIVSNLKYLYILPIVIVIFNNISLGVVDTKVVLFLLVIFSIITYMLVGVKSEGVLLINSKLEKNKDINKEEKIRISSFLNKIILLDKFIFIGELVMIIRFIAIILNFS